MIYTADWKGFVELVDHAGDERSVVRAARVSYQEDLHLMPEITGQDIALIKYLVNNDHMSPFEHTMMTLHVNAPLFVARQWMRHRIGWSYNEVSRRYTSRDLEFYVPDAKMFRMQSEKNKQASEVAQFDGNADKFSEAIHNVVEYSLMTYHSLLNAGIAREQARMVLPQNMYTRFYATCNLRSAMHFYKLRARSDAQWEISEYAKIVGEIAEKLFPVAWSEFAKKSGEKETL